MNQPIHLKCPDRRSWISAKPGSAFTLTELLVILAVLALLAAMLLPAMAGNQRKSKSAQCLANLRQIGMGCSVYANEFNGWYPIVTVGAANPPPKVNNLGGIHYTYYIYNSNEPDGTPMPQGYVSGDDQNLGYLYGGGMITDAHAFFCPAFSDVSPASPCYKFSADYYASPRFPSVHSTAIRSSYMFNPRMRSVTPTKADIARKYQKVSDCRQADVFAIDALVQANYLVPGAPFVPDNWVHWPYKGLQALFTDGSARFCTLTNATTFNAIVNGLTTGETSTSYLQYDTLCNNLQNAP